MGGDSSDIATGVNSCKNAVENNALSLVKLTPWFTVESLIRPIFGKAPETEYLLLLLFK